MSLRDCVSCGMLEFGRVGMGQDIVGMGPPLPPGFEFSTTPQPGTVPVTAISVIDAILKGGTTILSQQQKFELDKLAAKGKNVYADPALLARMRTQGAAPDWGNIALMGLGVVAAGGLILALLRRR